MNAVLFFLYIQQTLYSQKNIHSFNSICYPFYGEKILVQNSQYIYVNIFISIYLPQKKNAKLYDETEVVSR